MQRVKAVKAVGLQIVFLLSCVFGIPAVSGGEAAGTRNAAAKDRSPGFTLASYYFPNYHPGDPRNEKLKGPGWSEWELVKAARPRFPGHVQPKVPLWGYEDESDPAVMEKKIRAAADHGIDVFIFDWYWYDDGPFLERALERGFLRARNNRRLKFALMWADHDWIDIHPRRLKVKPALLYPGRVKPETFEKLTDYVVRNYFTHPSYWKIRGRPYFSIYDLTKLLEIFGSVAETRRGLDRFREKVRAAGLPGLHLNAVVWGRTILPGEKKPADPVRLVRSLGFDSVTSYVWIHHVYLKDFPETDYLYVEEKYFDYWKKVDRLYGVPYFPNVTMGWDSSPRAAQSDPYVNAGYPFMATISGNTPQRFREALEFTKFRLSSRPPEERILTLNCWNEWTEGSYLEPEKRTGMKYLQAIRGVFAGRATKRVPLWARPVEDVPGLPRVLLLGDSISIGYTQHVRRLLKGRANVHRPPMNCQSTRHALLYLDMWLGDGKWDVIHFNWGLHDLKYIDKSGRLRAKERGGKQQVPLEEYEKNLEKIVKRLEKTGAKLVWCSTTPVPEGASGRVAGDEIKYNRVAARVMKAHGIRIDDLYSFAAKRLKKIQRPRNVHFTAEGSKALAEVVVRSILQALEERTGGEKNTPARKKHKVGGG